MVSSDRLIDIISTITFFLFIILIIITFDKRPLNGPPGLEGNIGITGFTGMNGQRGHIGWFNNIDQNNTNIVFNDQIGVTGPDGPLGKTGPMGNIGDIGPTGYIGEFGPIGPSGVTGKPGPTGPTGDAGITPNNYRLNYNCRGIMNIPTDTKQYVCGGMYPIMQFIDKKFNRIRCCHGLLKN
jgi:hypothetical protein